MAVRAFITGLAGTTVTPAERSFLREREPWGFIIFQRNIETSAQEASQFCATYKAAGGQCVVPNN